MLAFLNDHLRSTTMRHTPPFSACSGIAVLCTALALAGGLQAQSVPPPGPPLPPTAVEQRTDKAISRDLRDRLAQDGTTRGHKIDVTVNDGIVKLSGTVPTAAV